jgi:hypothetical protein
MRQVRAGEPASVASQATRHSGRKAAAFKAYLSMLGDRSCAPGSDRHPCEISGTAPHDTGNQHDLVDHTVPQAHAAIRDQEPVPPRFAR